MPPRTKNAAKRTNSEVIVVHDSDSAESDPEKVAHSSKRQKTNVVDSTTSSSGGTISSDPPHVHIQASSSQKNRMTSDKSASKNAHLKGRKRFTADLEDAKQFCQEGFECHSLQIKRLKNGDDEGSIEFVVLKDAECIVSINLLVSDTSEYPEHHTFFAFSPDTDLSSRIQEIIEGISSGPSRPIIDTIEKLLRTLSRALDLMPKVSAESQSQAMDQDEDEDGDGDEYYAYDEDLDYLGAGGPAKATLQLSHLQRDFVETVAAGYRPGLIRFGVDEFSISVSLPVLHLASDIPARALMAWDRRLLSRSQHLTLLVSGFRGTYPPLTNDGTLSYDASRSGTSLKFLVGLTRRYKPGKSHAADASRSFGLIIPDAEAEAETKPEPDHWDTDEEDDQQPPEQEEEPEDDGRFDKFSLSNSLESLLDYAFVRVLQLRKKFSLGWAGAELLLAEAERSQMTPDDVFAKRKCDMIAADKEEARLARSYRLPPDPLIAQGGTAELNFPLVAFCYLVRRLTLCTRFCPVCHNTINAEFEVLKPYVCDSKLCAYQYYSMNRGSSLEYEIRSNPGTVDLLVSIAYSAASEQVLDEPLPVGLGLRVPVPDATLVAVTPRVTSVLGFPIASGTPVTEITEARCPPPRAGPDGLCEFDEMDIWQQRASIAEMINSLPSIPEMKKHLEKKVKVGKIKQKLRDMDPSILPAAWSILRWCVASCTAHLEELTSEDDMVRNIDPTMKQFRFSVGAPDAEAKFKTAVAGAQKANPNAITYPSLYAFHGSPLRNWHSIIRHGLWFRTVTHGRAYGNGVYFAKDGSISMATYAQGTTHVWRNSTICPTSCTALAEIVNLPSQFVSQNPYFVVQHTEWIICRYLIVRTALVEVPDDQPKQTISQIPTVNLDPAHPLTLGSQSKRIKIPEPSYKLESLISALQEEYLEEDFDEDDMEVFEANPMQSQSQQEVIDDDDDMNGVPPDAKRRPGDDWEHDAEWVNASTAHLLPPPIESTPSATMALQRELRAMMKEQEKAVSLKELGWYMTPDTISDNLFQWIVELHSFDATLPIAKDMVIRKLNSIIFEIRFPPTFPLSPPFFRIIKPRFLPFIHGGGGHVTGGGSMCMDLLTADGWLPSYSISAILLQIKLAISNLEPRPARLAANWDSPYGVHEALEGYKRAATTHGWKIPEGIDKLAI